MLVPTSMEDGFLDFTAIEQHVWRHQTTEVYVTEPRDRVPREVVCLFRPAAAIPRLAKLATDVGKPGFLEIPSGTEKEFLKDRPGRELSGSAQRCEHSLLALSAWRFGDVAKRPSRLLQKRFGIWGQQLWIFANGQWNEPLLLKVLDRTTISSATTLPYDEPAYEAALTFALSEMTRLVGQLRVEQLQARELALTVRLKDFTEVSGEHRFRAPQFPNSTINGGLEEIFREIMSAQAPPVRPIRVAVCNLLPLGTQRTLGDRTAAQRGAALDDAAHTLNQQLGKTALRTGVQLALPSLDGRHRTPKPRCPFVPQARNDHAAVGHGRRLTGAQNPMGGTAEQSQPGSFRERVIPGGPALSASEAQRT